MPDEILVKKADLVYMKRSLDIVIASIPTNATEEELHVLVEADQCLSIVNEYLTQKEN